jgi:catechol 2,3-dioxygenase
MRGFSEIIIDLIVIISLIGVLITTDLLIDMKNNSMKDRFEGDSEYIGIVNLNIKNIDTSKEFYTKALLLEIISETNSEVVLGKSGKKLLILTKSDLMPAQRNSAGLYHFAIVYESRSELANIVRNVIENYPQFYAGSADHKVSQAFYFQDTEGNGIELYVDKPKNEWIWINNTVQMDTTGLNPEQFYNKYYTGATGKVWMGHVHLKVGNLESAKKFYVDILGFDITSNRDGALFVSKGGYHHNIGLNIWNSEGAGIRGETLGLNYYEIILKQDFKKIESKLKENNIEYKIIDGNIHLKDPWGTKIILMREYN